MRSIPSNINRVLVESCQVSTQNNAVFALLGRSLLGFGIAIQLFICHEVTHVDIFVSNGSVSSEGQDATLVAARDIAEYAMCAELRGEDSALTIRVSYFRSRICSDMQHVWR